jgi:small GTP-binding protein
MKSDPTNAAILLTSQSPAAIAVVRIRGPRVRDFLKNFSRPVIPGRAIHGEWRDGDRIIDDPVVVVAPDLSWADISLHGGSWVITTFLEFARKNGFTILDDPTPPTPELTHDDAANTLEREMLAHLPLAKTELAIRSLLAQPAAWESTKRRSLDIPAILADRSLWWLLHPPRVAIVGEPNVGKSTLANRLFGQERSITADIPGTTRDWVGEIANLGGLAVILVDTPGHRETTDEIERAALQNSQSQIQSADLILQVLDATRVPSSSSPCTQGEDRGGGSPRILFLVNKCDQPPGWDFSPLNPIQISAKTGQGVELLIDRIHNFVGIDQQNVNHPRWWTDRQRDILTRAFSNPSVIQEL